MTIGSLFSGIGGLELGLEWAGLGPTLWQVECDEFCRGVLERHWPDAERFTDVRSVGAANLRPVDLICGGFPCQDVSSAGKGEGLTGERSGLWREYARVIDELAPRWVIVENVAGGASRWLDEVVRDLEQLGYEVLPVPLSASDVGAPHQRARVFLVAHANRDSLRNATRRSKSSWPDSSESRDHGAQRLVANTQCGGRQEMRAALGQVGNSNSNSKSAFAGDAQVAELPSLAGGASAWAAFPDVRGVDDGVPNRSHRLRALGNAVVPQCAEVVGWVVRELMEAA